MISMQRLTAAADVVPTAELAVGGGVVGLYNISTRETHRRRGFGSRLTLQPLLDARALGYHTAVLQVATEGVSIYQRLGFRRFGDITEYKPREKFADNAFSAVLDACTDHDR